MVVGIATSVAGIALIIFAAFGRGGLSPEAAGLAVVIAAVLELMSGVRLEREGAPGMAHIFAGALALFLAVYVVAIHFVLPGAASGPPIALALGLFCFCNALFRGIDLFVDRPSDVLFEAVDVAFTFVVGAVLFANWRTAGPGLIGVAAGVEVLSGGLSLVGSAWVKHQFPGEPPYDGRSDRLARAYVKSRRNR